MMRGSIAAVMAGCMVFSLSSSPPQAQAPPALAASFASLQKELTAKYGQEQATRLDRGMRQVAEFWRVEDGDAEVFGTFVRANFAGTMRK